MGMVSFLLQTITTTNGLKLAYQTISVNSAGILGSPNPDPPLQSWSILSNPLLRLMLDGSPPLRLFTVTKEYPPCRSLTPPTAPKQTFISPF